MRKVVTRHVKELPIAWKNCVKLNLSEELEARSGGIKVSDLAVILGVDDKHIGGIRYIVNLYIAIKAQFAMKRLSHPSGVF